MSIYPLKPVVGAEHTRSKRFTQANALAILSCFIFLTLVQAEEIGTASVNVLPTGGKHRGIVLKAQTVDAVVSNQEGTVVADTKVWLRLYNPASRAITVSVTLPGPQLFPARVPPDLQMLVDDAPFPLTVSNGSGSEEESGSGLIGIPARGSVDVRLSYRQALSDRDGRVVYAYMLSGADQWAGNPESLRVTVELRPPLSTDQLTSPAVPTPHRADAHSLTWDWEADWAKTQPSICLALMTPTWWDEYSAARAAATRDGAGAAEHLALAQHYRRLASLPSLPFEGEEAYHTRHYPSVIAELRSAIAASTSLSNTVQARTLLADLYREEADRAAPEAVVYYLQSAAEEIRSAIDDGTPGPDLIALAKDVYAKLAQHALEQGNGAISGEYRGRLANLQDPPALDQRDPQRLVQPLGAANRAIEEGDLDSARQLIAEAFGPAAAVLPEAPRPVASQSVINVIHTPDRRIIGLTLERSEKPETVNALIAQTATATRAGLPIEIITDTNHLTLTLPFQNSSQLAQLQRTLAQDLPSAPELALLGAVLSSAPTVSETATGPVSSTWRFEEQLDLTRVARQWYQLAERLDAASAASAMTELPQDNSSGLAQVQQALWTADARAWREMVRNSRVDYLVSVNDPVVSRTWQIPAGASRDLLAEVGRWNLQRLRSALLVAAILVIGAAVLMWRLG